MQLDEEKKGVHKNFYDLCLKVVGDLGLELYDVDYIVGQKLLRVYIMDKTTGSAVIEDCVKVDHALSPHIETLDWVPESLTLEVSSPGINRFLRTQKHFECAIGKKVALHLSTPVAGESLPKTLKNAKKLSANLLSVENDGVKMIYEGHEFFVQFRNMKKANLDFDINSK